MEGETGTRHTDKTLVREGEKAGGLTNKESPTLKKTLILKNNDHYTYSKPQNTNTQDQLRRLLRPTKSVKISYLSLPWGIPHICETIPQSDSIIFVRYHLKGIF